MSLRLVNQASCGVAGASAFLATAAVGIFAMAAAIYDEEQQQHQLSIGISSTQSSLPPFPSNQLLLAFHTITLFYMISFYLSRSSISFIHSSFLSFISNIKQTNR